MGPKRPLIKKENSSPVTTDKGKKKLPVSVKSSSLNNVGRKKENEKDVQSRSGVKSSYTPNVTKLQFAPKELTRSNRKDLGSKEKKNSESCASINGSSSNNQLKNCEKGNLSSNSSKNVQSGIEKETNNAQSKNFPKWKNNGRAALPPFHPVALISDESKRFKQKIQCNENSVNENKTNIKDKFVVQGLNKNQNFKNDNSKTIQNDLPDLVINSQNALSDKSVDLIVKNDLTENISNVCDEDKQYSNDICSFISVESYEQPVISSNSSRGGEDKWEIIETSSEVDTVSDSLELVSDNSPKAVNEDTFVYYVVNNNSSERTTNDYQVKKSKDLTNSLFSNMCDSSKGLILAKCPNQIGDNKLINDKIRSTGSSVVSNNTYVVDRPMFVADVLKSISETQVQNDIADMGDFLPQKSQIFSSLLEETSEAANTNFDNFASPSNKDEDEELDSFKRPSILLNNNNKAITSMWHKPPTTKSVENCQSNKVSELASSLEESNDFNSHSDLYENSFSEDLEDDGFDDVDILEFINAVEMNDKDVSEASDCLLSIIPVENSPVGSVITNILNTDDEFDLESEVITDVIDDIDAVWSDVKFPIKERKEVADPKWTDNDSDDGRRDTNGESVVFLNPNDEDWIITEKNLHELRMCLDECREEVELAAKEMQDISNKSNVLSNRDKSGINRCKKQLNVSNSSATIDHTSRLTQVESGSGGKNRRKSCVDDGTDYFSVSSGDEFSDTEDWSSGDKTRHLEKASQNYLSFGKSCDKGRKKTEKKSFSSLLSSFFKSKNIVEK